MNNKLKLINSLFNNIILRKPTPYILLFEPSQLCNCKCEFCYHWKEYDKNELKKKEIFDISTYLELSNLNYLSENLLS